MRENPLNRFRIEDGICILFIIFFAVQGAIPGIAPNQALETNLAAPSGLMKIGGIASQAFAYGAILLLCLRRIVQLIRALHTMHFGLLLAGWVLCSTAWSIDPWLTARRAPAFLLTGLLGLYLAERFPLERQLYIFWTAMVLLATATVIVAIGFPEIGLERSAGHSGDWQGVFTQKNACGRMMVLATAVALSSKRSWAKGPSLVLFLGVLLMSGSRGAWLLEAVVLSGAIPFALLSRLDRRARGVLLVGAALFGLSVGLAAFAFRVPLMQLLGRDATLSGRLGIWDAVWQRILERPWFGYGYAAFWRGWTGPSFEVSAAVHFLVFHAHNGYLDLWLQIGLVGLLLFIAAYGRAWQRVLQRFQRGDIEGLFWPVSLLVIVGLYGIDENMLLIPNGLFWMLFVLALVQLERGRVLRRREPAEQHSALSYATSALPAG
jgi:exopolysaccharide production protein ExoQ